MIAVLQQRVMGRLKRLFFLMYLCTHVHSGLECEVLGKFEMRDMFQDGDVMIGGIFPIFNKQENFLVSFKKEPDEVTCKG